MFYYSTMRGGMIVIGTYEIKDDAFTADVPADREEALTDKITHFEGPQTMYFYNMSGEQTGSIGYNEAEGLLVNLDLAGNVEFSQGIVMHHIPDAVPGEGDYAEEFGQAVAHYYDPANAATAFIDIMHNGTFQDLVGDMMKEGTWTVDGSTYTLTESGETDTYTLVVDGATATYTDVDGNVKTLETDVAEEGGEADVLFSWNTGSDNMTMDCYADGTYKFAFVSYGLEETGTWTWAGWSFKFVSANGQEFVAEQDDAHTLNVHFIADANAALTAELSCGADVWGVAFAGTGDYTPVSAAPAILFSWTSGSDTILMDCYADGTYKFSFTSYNIEEIGTWTWAGWAFTFTTANGQEHAATMDDAHTLTVHFVSDTSDQLAADFTCEAGVWGAALGTTGEYTPAG